MMQKELTMSAEQEFEIKQDQKDKKQVVINDNFLDVEFNEQDEQEELFKEEANKMNVDTKNLPLWA